MARMAFEAFPRAVDANGSPVSGGFLYVYEAGTTTDVTSYSDLAMATPHAQPVVADSAGFFPQIYLPAGSYKVVVKTPAGVTIDEADNVVQAQSSTDYSTVALLLASTEASRGTGEIWEGGGQRYIEVASGGDVTNSAATPVELDVLPGPDGEYNIEAWGVSADGATDDSTLIQAAIDKVESLGGGTLFFPKATYAIDAKLYVDNSHVMLRGEGRGYIVNSKVLSRATIATRFLWGGSAGGTMLEFTSDRDNDGTEVMKVGGGIHGIGFDGDEVAGEAVIVNSWCNGSFKFLTCYCDNYHWFVTVLSNGTLSSAGDTQENVFDIISHDVNSSNQPTTQGIISGQASENVSFNHFTLLLKPETSAIGLEVGGSDSNIFHDVRCSARGTATGSGGKVILHADDTMTTVASTGDHCRKNTFIFLEAADGLLAKATVAGSDSAQAYVLNYSDGNGSPFPSTEEGALVNVGNYGGLNRAMAANGTAAWGVYRPNPATNEFLGTYPSYGTDSAENVTLFSEIKTRVIDATDASEDGQIEFLTTQGGTSTRAAYIWQGLTIGHSTTGGDPGVGGVNADFFEVNGTQVLTDQQTGWGAPTGTATRTTFATGSVTLEQLAERVHALIDDLTTHGVIGS